MSFKRKILRAKKPKVPRHCGKPMMYKEPYGDWVCQECGKIKHKPKGADDGYLEADVEKQIFFDSEWGLFAESLDELNEKYPCVDNVANAMHERIVDELSKRITKPTRSYLTVGDLQKYPKDTRIYVGGYDKNWHWHDFAFLIDDGCLDEDNAIYFESIPPYEYIHNRSDK